MGFGTSNRNNICEYIVHPFFFYLKEYLYTYEYFDTHMNSKNSNANFFYLHKMSFFDAKVLQNLHEGWFYNTRALH